MSRRGFTLPELLAVVVIIGTLLALIFPAIAMMRESARRTDCQHRMVEVAKGIQLFSTKKNAYPGWRQTVKAADGNTDPVGWLLVTTPYLDAQDIYDNWIKEPDSSRSRRDVQRPLWVCPSDNYKAREKGPVLSFVINAGRPDWPSKDPADKKANGIAMDLTRVPAVTPSYLAQADGQANTLLLSENLNAGAWMSVDAEWKTTMLWWAPHQPVHEVNSTAGGINEDMARPSSNHRDGVNAVMAAGHARWIDNGIDYNVYRDMLTCSGDHADNTSVEPTGP